MKIKKEILAKLGIQEESGSSKDGVECCSTGDADSEEHAMAETAPHEEQVKKKKGLHLSIDILVFCLLQN